ncbi:arylsulfotransferase family protein [Haloglomus halophilum]|uniref:arylsulfotransferase family protein n=1 Tax=Haloglomus halophilum TaxID=2962672 RepID=UPI0020C94D6C|nr:arylsulfotransferase family protein [Haloglomus halophilum]
MRRPVTGRDGLRLVLVLVVLVASGLLVSSWLATPPDAATVAASGTDRPLADRDSVVGDRSGPTVITTDPPGGGDGRAAILAFTADGRPLYHDDSYGNYFDVDPDPPGSMTVLYVAGSRYDPCPDRLAARTDRTFEGGCAEVVVERTNLTTGVTERLHTAVTAWDIWHDVDRVGEHRLLVADIAQDRAFVLNTRTGEREWTWAAEQDIDRDAGGQAGDWTHINDVERLPDGRVMASLRNNDRVVFIDPGEGVDRNWTLGAEDAYDVLYEQHNPDYIPAARGGPAVLVADSENNRVVEYQRTRGRWRESWSWRDDQLRWPRDADRLPGGHTLVTDSQGNRVLELDDRDRVVWQVTVSTPYEAERLGTGDESATGRSEAALRNGTGTAGGDDPPRRSKTGLAWFVAFLRGPVVNGLLYAAPGWMTVADLAVAGIGLGALGTLAALELHWSRFGPAWLRRRW